MRHTTQPASFIRKPIALAIALSVSSLSSAVFSDETPVLEEVLVTAQKRVETLQEVPISVAAVTGEKLQEAGVENLEDLTAHLPSIHFTETGISTQVRVRGIGSDNSQGFEQSVGMYVDGTYYGRAQLFRVPMMDMERAELLRGPQSTLFGKNSVAGALNLSTAKPTETLEGRVAVSSSSEFAEKEINAVLSGPISDQLRARIAIREYEDDGYMYNQFTRTDEPSTDESAVRISLDWTPTDELSFLLKAERDTFDTRGRAIEITRDVPLTDGDPNFSQTLRQLGEPGFDAELNYIRDTELQEFSNNEVNNLTLTTDYEFSNMTLTAVTSTLDYEYTETCDCDFVASEILDLDLDESYDQFSQEIRLTSPTGGEWEWIGGLFYQSYEQTFNDHLTLDDSNMLPGLPSIPDVLANSGVLRDFEQKSDAWALFGQATWNINTEWHLTFGARYTEETKKASKSINVTDVAGNIITDPVLAPTLGAVYLGVFDLETVQSVGGHDVSGKRDESAFTPMVNLQYDATDEMMLYASYTNGFKAGGFDPRSNLVGVLGDAPLGDTPELQFFEFEEEKADAFELGMKTSLADGRGELNLALYRTNYTDLQISQFDGTVGFNAGNAKDTVVQGLEVDGRWALMDSVTLSYGASWLDFEYKDFKNGNCYAGQTPDGLDLRGGGDLDSCDYTGKRGVYTPEYTLNLSLDYAFPVSGSWDITGFIDLQQIDGHQVHVNLDPAGEIDAYTMLGARIALESEYWALALVGKNLLDEEVISYSGNAPLSDTQFDTNTFYSFVRKPRTVAVEGIVRF